MNGINKCFNNDDDYCTNKQLIRCKDLFRGGIVKELRQKRKDERKPLQPIWRSGSKTHGISMHKKVKINENKNIDHDMQNEQSYKSRI